MPAERKQYLVREVISKPLDTQTPEIRTSCHEIFQFVRFLQTIELSSDTERGGHRFNLNRKQDT
jgi:hypothetical protein